MTHSQWMMVTMLSLALALAGCEALPTGAASTDGQLVIPPADIMPKGTGVAAEAYAEYGTGVLLHEESDRLLIEARGGPGGRRAPSAEERAKIEQESGDLWKQAVGRYQKALAADSKCAAACERLSVGYFDRGDGEQGIRWLKEAARLNPGDFSMLYRLGVQSERAGRIAEAIQAYAQAERAPADDDDKLRVLPLIILKLSSLQESQGRPADAAATYERFMKLPRQPDAVYEDNPALVELLRNYGPIWRKLGELYRKTGKTAEAVAAYREALKLQPDVPQALLRIAETHRDAGNLQGAVDACKEYVEREPNRLDGMTFLVEIYKSMGHLDKAVTAAQQFLKEKPFLYQLHYLLGTLHEQQGDVEKALAEYQLIVRDGKKFVPAYVRVADLESKRGKIERALAALARGLAVGVEDESFYGDLDRRIVEAAKVPDVVARFRLAVPPDQQDFAFYYVLGRLNQEMKKNAEAAVAYREAVRLKGDFSHGVIRLASVLIADNQAPQAAAALHAAAEKEPENMLLWRFLADAEAAAGNPAGAVEAMKRVVALDPANAMNTALLVAIMAQAGQVDAAEGFLERNLAKGGDDSERWAALLATFLVDQNRKLDRAVEVLKDALDDDAENAALTALLGRVYLKQGDYVAAADAFRRAVHLDPESLGARAWLAQALEDDKKLDEAEKELREALRLNPDAQGLVAELGRFLIRTKRAPEEGLALLRKAAAAAPDDPAAALALASGYVHLKRHAEALQVLTTLVQKNPDYTPARYQLAMTWDELKDFPKAEAELKGLLAKDPDDDMAANALGYMYAERGIQLEEAKRLLEVALKQQPENGAYLDSMGWVYFRQGNLDKAIEYLTKANAREKDAVIAEHLGDVCYKLGRKDDALGHYKDAAKLDDEGQTAAAKKVEAVKAGKDPLSVVK